MTINSLIKWHRLSRNGLIELKREKKNDKTETNIL